MYIPDEKILKKYADVLVKFALNSGKGIKKDDVVMVVIPDIAKPLLVQLNKSILEAGGHPLLRMYPTGIARETYELSSEAQLEFYPAKYIKARIDLIDHQIGILAEHDMQELKGVDPKKIMLSMKSREKSRRWQVEKENKGLFTWTLALYGTPAMAKEAGLSLENYWNEIIKACFLDEREPILHWRQIFKEQARIINKMNSLQIDRLHFEGPAMDLWVKVGDKRKWFGGSGRNIPSFEIFTSPDWRGTEGWVRFNQPVYVYGDKIKDVYLEFKKGKVVKAEAKEGNELLQHMVAQKNADKVGEISLTDGRASRITKFMANTLFDENIGGRYGNTHLALGMSYKDTYDGDPSKLKANEWKALGYNTSPEHQDIISTENRTVTAYLPSGRKKVIYKSGKFVI